MSIPRVSSASLQQFIELRKGMEDIVASLKNSKHLRKYLTRKRIVFDEDKSGDDTFVGVYGSWKPFFFYLGFAFRQIATAPKMKLYIERSLRGRRRNLRVPKELRKYYNKRLSSRGVGETWFVFEQPVNQRLNGSAEAMRLWFHETSQRVLAMGKE
jgi:hypothetical protein